MFQAFRVKPGADHAAVRQALQDSRLTLGSHKEFAVVDTDNGRFVVAGKKATALPTDVHVRVGDGTSHGYQGKVIGTVVDRVTAPFSNWKVNTACATTLALFAGTMACVMNGEWLGAASLGYLTWCGWKVSGALCEAKEEQADKARATLDRAGIDLTPVRRDQTGDLVYRTDTGNVPA